MARSLLLAAASVACHLTPTIDFAGAFSSFVRQPATKRGGRARDRLGFGSGRRLLLRRGDDGDDDDDDGVARIESRREFFSKVAAVTAPILLAPPDRASAVTNEPTRIELSVDTEYLIRVLEYFDGDMRKVLGALVRSPQTSVEITPPVIKGSKFGKDAKLTPEDAILRALYSYNAPEDYVDQASWVKVDKAGGGWVEALTKKRYKIELPSVPSIGGSEEGEGGSGSAEVIIRPNTINLSNLEAAVGLGVLSYPLAYSYYNYESYKEEQAAKEKKAKMAAKKAAKAAAAKKGKGTASTKSTKGTTVKKEKAAGKSKEAAKPPKAVKGQEAKKDGAARSAPKKKATTAAKDTKMTTRTMGTKDEGLSDKIATEMMDSRREKFVAETKEKKNVEKIAEDMIDSRRENFVAKTEEKEKVEKIAEEMMDSQRENFIAANEEAGTQSGKVEEYVAAAERQWSEAARPEPPAVQPSINELEKLVAAANAASPSAARPLSRPAGATGYLDDLSLNFSESAQPSAATDDGPTAEPRRTGSGSLRSLVEDTKPRRGAGNSYLDSL